MKRAMLVTGGTEGTGLGIAERFAKEGYNVFITSRSAERAQTAADILAKKYGIYAKGYGLEIGSELDILEMFKDIDSSGNFIETIVLNATNQGTGKDPAKGLDFFEAPMDEITDVFMTNLVWNYMVVRHAALRMREKQKGSIVFLSSVTAHRAIPNRSAYSASKGGIIALSKALAVDLGVYGIRCNVVLPGLIKTERWKKMGEKQNIKVQMAPLGELVDYEDVANAVWYLGSDEAKVVTGAEITVDGGMCCQWYPHKYINELRNKKELPYDK